MKKFSLLDGVDSTSYIYALAYRLRHHERLNSPGYQLIGSAALMESFPPKIAPVVPSDLDFTAVWHPLGEERNAEWGEWVSRIWEPSVEEVATKAAIDAYAKNPASVRCRLRHKVKTEGLSSVPKWRKEWPDICVSRSVVTTATVTWWECHDDGDVTEEKCKIVFPVANIGFTTNQPLWAAVVVSYKLAQIELEDALPFEAFSLLRSYGKEIAYGVLGVSSQRFPCPWTPLSFPAIRDLKISERRKAEAALSDDDAFRLAEWRMFVKAGCDVERTLRVELRDSGFPSARTLAARAEWAALASVRIRRQPTSDFLLSEHAFYGEDKIVSAGRRRGWRYDALGIFHGLYIDTINIPGRSSSFPLWYMGKTFAWNQTSQGSPSLSWASCKQAYAPLKDVFDVAFDVAQIDGAFKRDLSNYDYSIPPELAAAWANAVESTLPGFPAQQPAKGPDCPGDDEIH